MEYRGKSYHLSFGLLILQFILQADGENVYLAPDIDANNETCIWNGTTLRPCYSVHQLVSLSDNQFYEESVTLFLLPGRHLVPERSTFAISNISELAIYPWNEQEYTAVDCEAQSYIRLNGIEKLILSSIVFNSCTIVFTLSSSLYFDEYMYTLSITNCTFNKRGPNYTIIISYYRYSASIHGCKFYSNSGAIRSRESDLSISNTVFLYNSNDDNGGALFISDVKLQMNNCEFSGNAANLGGAIYSTDSTLKINSVFFSSNSANARGGAVYSLESDLAVNNTKFVNNSARMSGGASYFEVYEPASYNEFYFVNTVFVFNKAGLYGGAVYGKFYSNTNLDVGRLHGVTAKYNSADSGGFAYLSQCLLYESGSYIGNNSAISGGAISAHESELFFSAEKHPLTTSISHNRAKKYGGGLFLRKSVLLTTESSLVVFQNNVVTMVGGQGGAIFVPDSNCKSITYPDNKCFIDYLFFSKPPFKFLKNKADQGSVLYGGLLDRCLPSADFILTPGPTPLQVFKNISYFENIPFAITSAPIKVCFCYNGEPICSLKQILYPAKMRGESVRVSVVALDQDDNPVPATLTARYRESLSAQLQQGEGSRAILNSCTDLDYHIYTAISTRKATLILEPFENPCRESMWSTVTISVRVKPCIRGFEELENTCGCDRRLTEHFNITLCDIDSKSFVRSGSVWLRYDDHDLKIVHNCPLDYCRITDRNISLFSPDDQCANRRSGVLCGKCQGNYSIALGGSKCIQCTSSYSFIWLTVVFAVAGLALVALLLVCNITISHGTLNGLIFYANVVSTSGLTSLHNCSISPILSVFIAWVNLDLGVETCFYSGMDTYQKTWLQFAFPLYIWILVVAIILASHYSSTAMKLFGSNNIAILATLFLLSYSKILKTIVTALSFTQVWRGAADDVNDPLLPYRVWTYDGNIEYLKDREHIALFIVAFLLLVFLFMPYTLMLLFGQCVRSMPVRRRWGLQWIRSTAFISIMDAYHAPYNRKHRYWTGLMLLTRCILFLVFATSSTDNSFVTNLFAIILLVIGILLIKSHMTKIYRRTYIEILDVSFLLNLGVLSAALHYLRGIGINSGTAVCKTITASISISFISFLGILVYHAHLQIRKTKYYISMKQTLLNRRTSRQHHTMPVDSKVMDSVNLSSINSPTTTTVELREKLLESS